MSSDHAHAGHSHPGHLHAGHSDAGHSHAGHGHSHAPASFGMAFAVGIALNTGFVIVEAVFGLLAGSMALIADAGHNFSDVLGLIIAWAGAVLAKRASSRRFTYGLKKGSILAALFNALFLLVAIGAIVAEAIRRFLEPAPVAGRTVIIVALIGIAINFGTALMFMRGREHDINIRGAFLHMAADAAVSAAVVVAGFMILLTGQQWIDPVMSLVIAAVVFWGTYGLLKESVWMTLAGVPKSIDHEQVELALCQLDAVDAVHDLHIWPLSTTETALTAHIVTGQADYPDALLSSARTLLRDHFGIEHCTIQVERQHPDEHNDC